MSLATFYHFRTTAEREKQESVIEYFQQKFINYIIVRHKINMEGEHLHILFYSQEIMTTQRQQIKAKFKWMTKTNYYLAQKDDFDKSLQYLFHDKYEIIKSMGNSFSENNIAKAKDLAYSKETPQGEIKSERKTQKESHLEFILRTFQKPENVSDTVFKHFLYKHVLQCFGKKVKILDGSIIRRHLEGALNILKPKKVEKDLMGNCFSPDEMYEISRYGEA